MKKLHKIIAASLLASTATTGVAVAESPLTANVGVTSNYIWRGATQTSDTSAVSGGIDYSHSSGAYVGIWTSNQSGTTPAGYEQDIYAGFKFDAGPVGMDVGYIKYMYPIGSSLKADFDEVYVNASYSMFSAGVALTTAKEDSTAKKNDKYAYISADFEIKKDLTLGLTFGKYDMDGGSASDYNHTKVSLSKGDFTFAYEDTDKSGNDGDPRLTVSWGQSFDL